MLVPLNRYFQTLVPTLSPLPSPPPPMNVLHNPSIKPFSLPGFLSHVRTHGPNPLSFRTRGLSTKARVENDFYASFGMSPTFAGWLAARVESLGLAVAAHTSTLVVPGTASPQRLARPVIGLGLNTSLSKAMLEGRASPTPATNYASESDGTTRRSSEDESSTGAWRASEESPRQDDTPLGQRFYVRRTSEGLIAARREEQE